MKAQQVRATPRRRTGELTRARSPSWTGQLGAWQIVARSPVVAWARWRRQVRADDAYQQDVTIKLIRDGRERPGGDRTFRGRAADLASLDH